MKPFTDRYGITIFGFLSIMVFIIIVICFGAYKWDKASCEATAKEMNRKYKYSLFTECLIQDNDGKFVPLKNYREINVTK